MAIFWFIKCQIVPQTSVCSLTYKKHSSLLLPLRIAITEKYSSETRLLYVLVQLCQEGKNIFLYAANTSRHPSSVRKPLADWVVPLSGMKKPLAVALDCEMGYHSRAFLANAERRLLGNSWDSKHHNWSGYSVGKTGIQMREVHMQNRSPKFPQFALILHPEAVSLWLPATPDSLCHLVFTAVSCCIYQQPNRPLIMIQQQCNVIKTIPLPFLE